MGLNDTMRKLFQRVLATPVWVPSEPQGVRYAIRRYGHIFIPWWTLMGLFFITGVFQTHIANALGEFIAHALSIGMALGIFVMGIRALGIVIGDNLRLGSQLMLWFGPFIILVFLAFLLNAVVN